MLLDKRLMFYNGSGAGFTASPFVMDVLDIQGLGLAGKPGLMAFFMFRTLLDGPGTFQINLNTSALSTLGSATAIYATQFLPSTTNVPAGTLLRIPIPVFPALPYGAASGANTRLQRYLGFSITYSAGVAPDANDLFLAWLGSAEDVPVYEGALN